MSSFWLWPVSCPATFPACASPDWPAADHRSWSSRRSACRLFFNKPFHADKRGSLSITTCIRYIWCRDLSKMPRIPLPSKFEDGDFSSFRRAFERVAKANRWTDEEQLASLPLALAGRALLAFEKEENKMTKIADAYKILEEKFNSTLDREDAMKEFYACQWGVGLDLDVFATKLQRLLKKGLPSLGTDDVDRIVINQFINGFSGNHRDNLRLLFSGKSPSLSEVVAAAKDIVRRSDECRAFAMEGAASTSSRLAWRS